MYALEGFFPPIHFYLDYAISFSYLFRRISIKGYSHEIEDMTKDKMD